jgi:hypothetical protein
MTDNCSICLEEITENPEFLPCAHRYHTNCINQWIVRNPTCPMCKISIYTTSPGQLESQSSEVIRNLFLIRLADMLNSRAAQPPIDENDISTEEDNDIPYSQNIDENFENIQTIPNNIEVFAPRSMPIINYDEGDSSYDENDASQVSAVVSASQVSVGAVVDAENNASMEIQQAGIEIQQAIDNTQIVNNSEMVYTDENYVNMTNAIDNIISRYIRDHGI